MPNLANAKKAMRQSIKRRSRNEMKENHIATLRRKIRKLLEAKDITGAVALMPTLQRSMDKAVKVGIMKKNTVARSISRVAQSIKKARA